MKALVHLCILFVVALTACRGCDDTSSQTNNDEDPRNEACEDRDEDGWDGGLTCDGPVDCDDDDPQTNPDAEEVCDGRDNDCDGEVDEGCEACDEDGATRACGEETGRCEQGTQTCDNGVWSACDGAEGPFTEECNGEDDDCDGEVDEGGDVLCDDGFGCTGAEACVDGACVAGTETDCSALDGPCTEGICSEKDGGCVAAPRENGSACDDGNFCTLDGVCQSGVCETEPRDCSSETDACNVGVCDEDADACVKSPVMDGTTCDDGAFCTLGDVCTAGVCGGAARDCSAVADQCNTGVCDESADACVAMAVANDTPCDDGLYCNVGEACQAGQCTGGMARSCSAQGGSCRSGVCDEATDSCTGDPVPDGTACDDSQFCTTVDTCLAGTCVGGAARDCSALDGVCQTGICDENLNACAGQTASDGTTCDDGRFCTTVDSCAGGVCVGGGPAPDCSGVTGGDPCLIGVCDPTADMCTTTFDPVCCNVNVDADLDGSNECEDCDDANAAVRPGATEFCNGVDDDCDMEIDEDFDQDSDGYSGCSTDAAVFDCDDAAPNVNPGMTESCDDGMATNTGNGIDDDCDGYVDEGCNPCTTTDQDNDGVSECDGDCDDGDRNRYPGAQETCNGTDDDCNVFTTPNCGVSDSCNHDGDGDFANDPDVCRDDMLCACILDNNDQCNGNYRCTAFCNSSRTGAIGDGCEADQACLLTLVGSSNVNGCTVVTRTPGTLSGGASCTANDQCRSTRCDRPPACIGPGCNQKFCHDRCSSDSECDGGAYCRLYHFPSSIMSSETVFANCEPQSRLMGADVGAACGADSECARRVCVTDPNSAQEYCSELCCQDGDCPGGYYCSLGGVAERTTNGAGTNLVMQPDPDAPTCSNDQDCVGEGGVCFNGLCTYPTFRTAGQCVREVAGQGTNRGGQACSQNADCRSNFCEKDLGICIEPCCADTTCPTGTACELTDVETRDDEATTSRVCLSFSIDEVLERM